MIGEANVELLRRAWAAYDAGDIEAFAACLSDDWREYGPSGPPGGFGTLDDERRTMESHRIAFPDKHTEIHHIVAEDETAACHCTVTATHTSSYMELEATRERVVVHEMMFNSVRDGRLAETWAITSGAGFYEQLTGRPAPEQLSLTQPHDTPPQRHRLTKVLQRSPELKAAMSGLCCPR